MPSVFLSSCGNESAQYRNGASEDSVTGAVLALLQDYLQVSGLDAALRPAKMPSAMAPTIANRRHAQLLFGLRSYPARQGGPSAGAEICFHPASEKARRAAVLLEERLKPVVPSGRAVTLPSPHLPEFRMARCPAVQLRLGCRDTEEDAQCMLESTGVIAHALAKALTEWFGVPCKSPFSEARANVNAPGGSLALRRGPGAQAALLRPLPNGTKLTLLHREGDWQYVEADGACGYVMRKFLQVEAEKVKNSA